MTRLRKVARIAFIAHLVIGAAGVVAIVAAPPLVIGAGRFQEFVVGFETFDWRWLLFLPAVMVWLVPVLALLAWLRARRAGLEVERVSEMLRTLLHNKHIPITVDVDQIVPVKVEAALRIPMELDTKIALDESIDIETTVPIHANLPLDTEVETSVFGIGTIRIPIRANVPLHMTLPVVGKIHVRSAGLPIRLKDEVTVHLPEFNVPIRARLETKIDVLDNLKVAADGLRKRLDTQTPEG